MYMLFDVLLVEMETGEWTAGVQQISTTSHRRCDTPLLRDHAFKSLETYSLSLFSEENDAVNLINHPHCPYDIGISQYSAGGSCTK